MTFLPSCRATLGVRCAAEDTGLVVTAEEDQVEGFGDIVAGAIVENRQNFQLSLLFDRIGVPVCFGLSGKAWELRYWFGLTAEHIAERVLNLYAKRASAKCLAA